MAQAGGTLAPSRAVSLDGERRVAVRVRERLPRRRTAGPDSRSRPGRHRRRCRGGRLPHRGGRIDRLRAGLLGARAARGTRHLQRADSRLAGVVKTLAGSSARPGSGSTGCCRSGSPPTGSANSTPCAAIPMRCAPGCHSTSRCAGTARPATPDPPPRPRRTAPWFHRCCPGGSNVHRARCRRRLDPDLATRPGYMIYGHARSAASAAWSEVMESRNRTVPCKVPLSDGKSR